MLLQLRACVHRFSARQHCLFSALVRSKNLQALVVGAILSETALNAKQRTPENVLCFLYAAGAAVVSVSCETSLSADVWVSVTAASDVLS